MNTLAAICLIAMMQGGDDPSQRKVEAFRVIDEQVHVALVKLFDELRVPALLCPSVSGRVSVDLEGATFEAVLQSILKQVGLTYRVEKGVYQIVPRYTGPCDFTYPEYQVSDGQFNYTLCGVDLTKTITRTSEVVAKIEVQRRHKAFTADVSTPEGQRKLSELADLGDYNLVLVPGVRGVVRIPEGSATETLREGLKVTSNGRLQQLAIRLSEYVSLLGYELIENSQGAGETLLGQDKKHLDLTLGRWEYRIRKSDLKIDCFGPRTRF